MEDQVDSLALAELIGFFRPKQAFFDGFLLHPDHVDTSAVVPDLDIHLSSFVIRAKCQLSLGGLARQNPRVGRLHAVITGVSDEVNQRVLNRLDDGTVEFGLLAFHFQSDLFPEGNRHVAHHAWQRVPDHPDRLHAGLHDPLLQFRGNQIQPLGCGVQCGVVPLGVELQNLVSGQHQFAHQIHEPVQKNYAHSDIRVGDRRTAHRLPCCFSGSRVFAAVVFFRGSRAQQRRS